jgi:hypothetical protein
MEPEEEQARGKQVAARPARTKSRAGSRKKANTPLRKQTQKQSQLSTHSANGTHTTPSSMYFFFMLPSYILLVCRVAEKDDCVCALEKLTFWYKVCWQRTKRFVCAYPNYFVSSMAHFGAFLAFIQVSLVTLFLERGNFTMGPRGRCGVVFRFEEAWLPGICYIKYLSIFTGFLSHKEDLLTVLAIN